MILDVTQWKVAPSLRYRRDELMTEKAPRLLPWERNLGRAQDYQTGSSESGESEESRFVGTRYKR